MFYTRRFGALLTVTALVTSGLVALLLKPWIETLLRDRRPLPLIVAATVIGTVLVALGVYCVVYLGHLALIEATGKPELLRVPQAQMEDQTAGEAGGPGVI